MVGEDLHAKASVPWHLTAIHKISRSKRVRQQERLTPDDIFPDDILLKHQPSGKVLVREKSRKPSGNSERARTSEIKKLERSSLLVPGFTKRRKCELELKPVFVPKQPASVLLSQTPALDELRICFPHVEDS